MAHIQEDADDPCLEIALILQTAALFPAAPDGFLDGILLIRFDHQLSPGHPVQRRRHPDDGGGKGFTGQCSILPRVFCPVLFPSVRRRRGPAGSILSEKNRNEKDLTGKSLLTKEIDDSILSMLRLEHIQKEDG